MFCCVSVLFGLIQINKHVLRKMKKSKMCCPKKNYKMKNSEKMCNCDLCCVALIKKIKKSMFPKKFKNQKYEVSKELQNRKQEKKVCDCGMCNVLLYLCSINQTLTCQKNKKIKYVLSKKRKNQKLGKKCVTVTCAN